MPTWRPASGGVERLSAPVRVEGETLRPYLSCDAVQFGGHKGSRGSAYSTVTLSDPYWNSQQNNNRALISRMITRKITVSV